MVHNERRSYVIFGRDNAFDNTVSPDELDGTNGFLFFHDSLDSVSSADINNDGYDDLVIGHQSDAGGTKGQVTIIYGRPGEAVVGNSPPVARIDKPTVDEDDTVVIDILANDTDVDGDTLTVTALGEATNGTATLGVDGMVTYTPDANFHGTDSFTYTVSDGNGGTDDATVTVTVNSINDPPTAVDDEGFTVEQGETLLINTFTLRSNDFDIDGGRLKILAVGNAIGGTVTFDGKIFFEADADFIGEASFEYTLSDHQGGFDTGTVYITVTPPPGSDQLIEGDNGDNLLEGNAGNDTIRGFKGDDTLRGFGGNDILSGGNDDDWLYGGPGNDSLLGGEGDDRMFGEDGDDALDGGAGNDHLHGAAGNDNLIGKSGEDLLFGGDGNDALDGG
ncbi:MAG: tandem-95 repeat protein, partial [Acidobacteria bacterium]|nr:tandem-95 repeat protein [Acidobacteriota bacterium]